MQYQGRSVFKSFSELIHKCSLIYKPTAVCLPGQTNSPCNHSGWQCIIHQQVLNQQNHMTAYISRVPDQNGGSLLYIMLEIRHSGREPSILYSRQHKCFPFFCQQNRTRRVFLLYFTAEKDNQYIYTTEVAVLMRDLLLIWPHQKRKKQEQQMLKPSIFTIITRFFTVIFLTQSNIMNIWVASSDFTTQWLHKF